MSRAFLPGRAAMTLGEVMVAVAMLAIVGGPLIMSMLSARRNLGSSLADVQAVTRVSQVAERLAAVPAERLPQRAADAGAGARGDPDGVPRERWDTDLEAPPDGVDLAELVGDEDPPRARLWLDLQPAPEAAAAALGTDPHACTRIRVSLRYPTSPDPGAPQRTVSLTTLATRSP